MKMLGIGLVLIGSLLGQSATAQEQTDTTRLYAEVRKMQSAYQDKPVSFDIRYTYTSEMNPEVVLDSLGGHMDISGRSYHYSISTTEMTANEQYIVTLFKEEGIMYLAKAPEVSPVDPIAQMKAAIDRVGGGNYAVTETATIKSVHVTFKPGMPYKEFRMDFDKKTNMLAEMQYVVRTEMLMESMGSEEGKESVTAQYGEYAIVRCYFTDYQTLKLPTDIFDNSKFFYKEGSEFKAKDPYKAYQVFVGSPDLQ
jgi:hypothetical protein